MKNYTLKVLYTDGHSPDHAVFFLKERDWLFTGDEFVTEKPNAARKDEDAGQSLRVLKTLFELGPERLTSSGKIYTDAVAVQKKAFVTLRRSVTVLGQ